MIMLDGSTASIYFSIGDRIRVTEDVIHKPKESSPFSSKGLIGVVIGIWDKCEVDPHCCCAELAFDAPIEIRFDNNLYYKEENFWTAHFSIDEIQKIINHDSI